jgi:hypothetical protein
VKNLPYFHETRAKMSHNKYPADAQEAITNIEHSKLEISLYLITAYKNLTLLDYGLQKFNFT